MKISRSAKTGRVTGGSPPLDISVRPADRVVRYPTARSALRALIGASSEGFDVPADAEMTLTIKHRKGGKPLASRLLDPLVNQVLAEHAPRELVLKARTPTTSRAPEATTAPVGEALTAATALGQTVRERRQALDLTQQQLADRAGVGRRFIVDLERGKPTLELGKVLTVIQALGLALIARVADGG